LHTSLSRPIPDAALLPTQKQGCPDVPTSTIIMAAVYLEPPAKSKMAGGADILSGPYCQLLMLSA